MNISKTIFMVILITVLLTACNRASSQNGNQTIKLLPPSNNEIYFGAFPDFGGDEEQVSKERITDFEKLAGKNIAWAAFSQNWFSGLEYPKKEIKTISDLGIVPIVRLMPRSNFDEYKKEKIFTLEKIIQGDFDQALKLWAKEAKKDAIPILIDFGVEANGKWFSWNGYWHGGGKTDGYGDPNYPDGPEIFRDAYRHIIDIFRNQKVNNVTWLFHVSMFTQEPAEDWNLPKWYYPGDDYIDWIGASIYGALSPKEKYWDSYSEVLENDDAYKDFLEISDKKPFAILELGVTDNHSIGDKSQWLKDAFRDILDAKYISFAAVNYWHEDWDNFGIMTRLRIDSSAKALLTFQEAVSNPRFVTTTNISNYP